MRWGVIPFVVFVSCLLTGCYDVLKTGDYIGYLSVNGIDGITIKDKRVIAQVVFDSKDSSKGSVIFLDEATRQPEPVRNFEFSNVSRAAGSQKFKLLIPNLHTLFSLKIRKSGDKCFTSKGLTVVKVCLDEVFSVEVKNYKGDILFNYFSEKLNNFDEKYLFETPQNYKISDAMMSAMTKNINVRAAVENLEQAFQSQRAAHLNLLPHITFTGILAIRFGFPLVLIGDLGNVVPFLYPGRYIQARSQYYQFKAEEQGNVVTRLNTASAVQSVALQFIAARKIKDDLGDVLLQMQASYDWGLVHPEIYRVGCAERMLESLTMVKDRYLFSKGEYYKSLTELSQVMGLHNPNGILEVEEGSETPPLEALPMIDLKDLPVEQEKLAKLAIRFSFEIRQQALLKKAHSMDEADLLTNWIDPYGNNRTALGANLIPQLKGIKSFKRVLDYRLEEIHKVVRNNAYRWISTRNLLLLHFGRLKSDFERRKIRFRRIVAPDTIDCDEVKNATEFLMASIDTVYRFEALIKTSQAQIDRMTVDGFYRDLLVAWENKYRSTD